MTNAHATVSYAEMSVQDTDVTFSKWNQRSRFLMC